MNILSAYKPSSVGSELG